jgi:hypothetical protein
MGFDMKILALSKTLATGKVFYLKAQASSDLGLMLVSSTPGHYTKSSALFLP